MLKQVHKPADLVERIRNGDQSAESEFVKQYSRSLKLLLLKRSSGDRFAADECSQDALIIAITKMRSGEIREPENINAFLRQTALYVLVSYYRKQRRLISSDKIDTDSISDLSNNIINDINTDQIRFSLLKILQKLTQSRDIEILRRYYLQEHEKSDICENLGLSPAHFDRVLYRAKGRVREILNSQAKVKTILYDALIGRKDGYE